MTASIDITGKRFGRLVALHRVADRARRQPYWLCHCDCGKTKEIRAAHLRNGLIGSCGCMRGVKHGLSHIRIWSVWKAMKQRCANPNTTAYHRYGGRGITYSPEWEEFEPFLKWALSAGYADNLEIDRIDNDGDYTPGNCRFVTHYENSKRNGRKVQYQGETWLVADLARHCGVEPHTITTRLNRGWPIERAVQKPAYSRKGS